ncbi:hypothetical protein H4O20_05125 [Aequorivita sp. 609]|uniref:DUF6268 family outer membrane beta-barrel protein n=1 Tax=Aequorivita TaxID=153265 RepID=UPI0011232FC5|nr:MULTISPECIES: DUF6268 family outer membrane beta-barrel protein [Aequorivita]MBB6680818.1 hypothetical protein [Aequorivita sp. 609]
MNYRLNLLIVFIGLIGLGVKAQTTDLARVEFLNLPLSKSNNSIQRYRVLLQSPIPLKKGRSDFFVVGAEYRYLDVNIKDDNDKLAFGSNQVSSVKRMDLYLGYTWKYSDEWRLGMKVGAKVQSDVEGSLIADDFTYEVGVYAINDKRKDVPEGKNPYRLIAGLTYSTTPGRWLPLPILNYYEEFHPNWTFTIGVPKTNIRHYLNDSHKDAIQAFATLDNDYANLQQNFVPISIQSSGTKVAESIQTTIVLTGLGYEHFFTEHLVFYTYAAHSVYNNFRLEDGDGDKIYQINSEKSPYFRAGIKFKY